MNFYDNISNFNAPPPMYGGNNPMMNNPMMNNPMNNDINYKIAELENRIKKLELRISRLESEKNNNNYTEPDNSLYMI